MRKVTMEPGMKWAPFFIGLVLVPSPEEEFITYDEKCMAWAEERKSLSRQIESVSSPAAHVERRMGYSYRWQPIPVDGDASRSLRYKLAAHKSPQFEELLIGFATPAVAAAIYKILIAWINARAGREIKLKFGDWQADFKGFSQR
jgi:hypothetical protein